MQNLEGDAPLNNKGANAVCKRRVVGRDPNNPEPLALKALVQPLNAGS